MLIKYRVLVVEDNQINFKLVSHVLRSAGYEVFHAADANAARAFLTNELPHIIIMDIQLPGMDGLALTRLIKEDALTRHIPVIALTAGAMKGDDLKAYAAGCDGYIPKPFDTRQLATYIASFLEDTSKVQK